MKNYFGRVQSKKNMNKTIKRKKYEWELNGIVKCKECGEKMTLKVKYKEAKSDEIKSKKIYCLNGIKRHQGKCCVKGCKGISEEVLNTLIFQNLKSIVGKLIDTKKIKELIIKQNYESGQNNKGDHKELLYKELEKAEEESKILYKDNKNRIKKEIEIIEKEETQRPILDEYNLETIIKELINMKGVNRDIISDIIYDVQIDNENNITYESLCGKCYLEKVVKINE